ncbi:MAG: DUF1587 domain-containing protein, partial [Planctomycetota bacterium]
MGFCEPYVRLVLVGSLLASIGSPALGAEKRASDSSGERYQSMIQPLLARFCVECHGAKKPKAGLRLDVLDSSFDGANAETWHDVLNKVNAAEMPPRKAPQPNEGELRALVDWLTENLDAAKKRARSRLGRPAIRRLTRYEYANTVRDLLGVDGPYAENLPPEPTSLDGFQNDASALGMSPGQLEYYLESARMALRRAIVTSDRPEVVSHRAKKSEKARRNKKGPPSGSVLVPGGRFITRAREFPREGEVRVAVRVRTEVPEGAAAPRLRVTLGVKSDVKSFGDAIGETDLIGLGEEPREYEFRARIEDFPLPGHNPKFPGLVLTVWHVDELGDGTGKAKKKRKKRKKGQPPTDEAPAPEARIIVESLEFEGPVFESWPPASHRRIFGERDPQSDDASYVREIVARFGRRAFRRSLTNEELASFVAL